MCFSNKLAIAIVENTFRKIHPDVVDIRGYFRVADSR